jgi:hypothetical protein
MAEYKDLWDVVSSVQKNFEEDNDVYALTYYKHAQDEMRELILAGLYDAMVFKTVRIPIVEGVGTLPSDYSTYLKVGALHCGRILNLTYNQDLFDISSCCSHDECAQRMGEYESNSLNSPYWGSQWYYASYFHNGQYVAGAYGAGAGFHYGDFRIDQPNSQIVVERNEHRLIKEVVMEYRSNGSLYGINGIVNDDIIEAVVNGVVYRVAKYRALKDKSYLGLIELYKSDKNIAWRRVLARKSAFTMEGFLEIYRDSIRGVPKR